MPNRKKIYIIHTGGTIGMQRTANGYAPKAGFVAEQMALMPELQDPSMPEYVIHEYSNPIDSANISPKDWITIANDISQNYSAYDGFLVLHGTDTMAYTASALSFMLENLNKPVILLGSQLPLADIRNDARASLITSLLLANHYAIPEVCLYFNNQLLRGNRARKLNTHSFDAFAAPNFPPLATVGVDIKINQELWREPTQQPLQVQTITDATIVSLNLFPGMNNKTLENILALPLQGLVLQTYGSGNAPNNDPDFLRIIKAAVDRGIIVVNCTQCIYGSVNMQHYATGNALQATGVISNFDMTPEATLTKLYYLFSKKLMLTAIKQQMQMNLRGELSIYPISD